MPKNQIILPLFELQQIKKESTLMQTEETTTQSDINYALVEDVRPPMYKSLKYWGKKPHNIWAEFIRTYCPKGGFVLDPFAGSAMSAFEAIKAGRKAVCFDLNPMTSFVIEVFSSKFDEVAFRSAFESIAKIVDADPIYQKNFTLVDKGMPAVIFNFRWDQEKIVKIALERADGTRLLRKASEADERLADEMTKIEIPYWYPQNPFPNSRLITQKFIKDIGGNSFEFLWTRRNLYILSKIFSLILEVDDEVVKLQLLFGFIQALHLASKMVVPRASKSNREFSGSWGRADYMIRRRSMEQNPLQLFRRSCVEKQGTIAALRDSAASLPSPLKTADITRSHKIRPTANINYGIVDIADLETYVPDRSIDFIITDPPYAGLVQYLELSLLWLVWLSHYDKKYVPDLDAEITIKRGQIERPMYRNRLQNAFKQMHRVLKDDGKLVVTFHHKSFREWNDFVHAVKLADFKFDKVIHQYNKRSGEANVSNPYGTSGSDFYIRCVKHRKIDFSDDASGLDNFILETAIDIIAQRNEPTPYSFIVGGVMPELIQAGYTSSTEYGEELDKVLSRHEKDIFSRSPNRQSKAGDYWWFKNPKEFINYPDRPLGDRVEETVVSILRRKVSVKFDDVLGELFKKYPNGLTPDPRSIRGVLEKFAYAQAGRWKIKDTTIRDVTEHTRVLRQITELGNKLGYETFVGLREQPEHSGDGVPLRDLAKHVDLQLFKSQFEDQKIRRLEMIDALWFTESQNVKAVFEVENSTNFISAIQRASNLDNSVPKFMIIPSRRERELLSIRDELFVRSFGEQKWSYLTYDQLNRLIGFSKISLNELQRESRKLKGE